MKTILIKFDTLIQLLCFQFLSFHSWCIKVTSSPQNSCSWFYLLSVQHVIHHISFNKWQILLQLQIQKSWSLLKFKRCWTFLFIYFQNNLNYYNIMLIIMGCLKKDIFFFKLSFSVLITFRESYTKRNCQKVKSIFFMKQ